MILFIAPNPKKVKKREGFLQRIAAIDGLFADEEKIYFEDLKDSTSVSRELERATMVYVHSVYLAEKIIASYPFLSDKIVTDIHGAVPEEAEYLGNTERALSLAKVEKTVFQNSNKFVAVSQAMVDFYAKKYSLSNTVTWVILPIFSVKSHQQQVEKKPIVVYAGGAQKWQNVDLMVGAINKTYKKYSFKIITHSPDDFMGISDAAAEHTSIQSVPSTKVENYYKDASLGFVLRDDIAMNRIACPTKLIEYLGSRVVPIVLSPGIGDFKALGYSYFTLEEFEQKEINPETIRKAASNNIEVLEKLEKVSHQGETGLKQMYEKMKKQPKVHKPIYSLHAKLIEQAAKIDELEKEIAQNKEKIVYEAKMRNHYQNRYEEVISSKRWKLSTKFLKPLMIIKVVSKNLKGERDN